MKSLLISSCLLGENVRYDGGNCEIAAELLSQIKNKFQIISLCPEVTAGFSTPRNPIELSEGKIINAQGRDLTYMFDKALLKIDELVKEHNITLALMKESSPSCGVSNIYDGTFSGNIIDGSGIITSYLKNKNIKVFSENQLLELLKLV